MTEQPNQMNALIRRAAGRGTPVDRPRDDQGKFSTVNKLIVEAAGRGTLNVDTVDTDIRAEAMRLAMASYQQAAEDNDLTAAAIASDDIDALRADARAEREAATAEPHVGFDGGVRGRRTVKGLSYLHGPKTMTDVLSDAIGAAHQRRVDQAD
jgi:hypothetical protein